MAPERGGTSSRVSSAVLTGGDVTKLKLESNTAVVAAGSRATPSSPKWLQPSPSQNYEQSVRSSIGSGLGAFRAPGM